MYAPPHVLVVPPNSSGVFPKVPAVDKYPAFESKNRARHQNLERNCCQKKQLDHLWCSFQRVKMAVVTRNLRP